MRTRGPAVSAYHHSRVRIKRPEEHAQWAPFASHDEDNENENESVYMYLKNQPRRQPCFGVGRLVGFFWGPRPPPRTGV